MKLTKPFIILLLLPLVILLAGYGAVKILNGARTGGDRFNIRMDREVLFPWQDCAVASFNMDLSGEQFTRKQIGKTDIILVVDNSESMTEPVGTRTRFDVVRDVILNFIDNFESRKNVRLGLILFAGDVTHSIPLNHDPAPLRDFIADFDSIIGSTDFSPPLELAAKWLTNSTATGKYILFLTDGEPNPGTDPKRPNQIYLDSLAPNRVDTYMVGVGDQVPFHVLRDVIKNEKGEVEPDRVLTCHDPIKLQILFDQVGEKIGNVAGRQGSLTVPMATDAFSPIQPVPVSIRKKFLRSRHVTPPHDGANPFVVPYPVVFSRHYSGFVPVKPETSGIIKPFYRDFQFAYLDIDNTPKKLESGGAPYLLNITYGTLFWLYLPLLLYLPLSLLGRKTTEPGPKEKIVIPIDRVKTPGIIPVKHIRDKSKLQWVPTLVIGIGKTGRHVLTHLKQNLADTESSENENIQLLHIDVAESEIHGPNPDRVPGVLVQLDPKTEIYVPEPRLRSVTDVVRQYEHQTSIDLQDPLSTLELGEFSALPESITGLDNGTQNRPALARAWLFKELAQAEHSPLIKVLEEKLLQLEQFAAAPQFMQIVFAANTNGGTGAGLLLPLTVLLRRMLEKRQTPGTGAEIHLTLVDDRENYNREDIVPIRNRVLLDEFDLFSQAGRIPFPYHLVPPHVEDKKDILKGIVNRRPYNSIQVFARQTENPAFDLYPQAADGLLFLVERCARIESRSIFDGAAQKEGQLRKREKSESFTHVACRALIYPAGLIRQWLKLVLIKDIFSTDIALGGLTFQNDTFEIAHKGSVQQLFRHPLSASLLKIEAGGEGNRWVAFFLGDQIDLGPGSIALDTENFWRFIGKAVSVLLDNHVFTLPGLHSVLREMIERAGTLDTRQRNAQSLKYITRNLAFLDSFSNSIGHWLNLLLGDTEKKGLLQDLYGHTKQIQTIQRELLAMENCRFVLGLDRHTPESFRLDNLKEAWMCKWLDIRQPGQESDNNSYSQLRKRCLWKTVESGVAKPELRFEFYGDQHQVFAGVPGFKETFLEAVDQLSGQFLRHIKQMTIIEILSAYEANTPDIYGKPAVAEKLYSGFQTRSLLYMYMLPHHFSVRLTPGETIYVTQLKNEIDRVMRIGEISCFPRTSNTYRLYSLQVTALLRGDNRDSREDIVPFHPIAKLALEAKRLCGHTFGIPLPYALPFHYLALVDPTRFRTFSLFWRAGMIDIDPHDGLQTLRVDGQTYKLTRLPREGLEEAAARFVIDNINFPAATGDIEPVQERVEKMNRHVKQGNPIFCWMKLYVEN